jgi:hypothetical protein
MQKAVGKLPLYVHRLFYLAARASLLAGRFRDCPANTGRFRVWAFLAGLLPSIYSALKLDDKLRECTNAAAEFKNLQDRFRQAALVAAYKPFAEFETQFDALMSRFEAARKPSITPPERIFRAAQAKVKSGDYTFDVDLAAEGSQSDTP